MARRKTIQPKAFNVTFPQGFVGIADWQHFSLEPLSDYEGISVLQSTDDPAVCFVLVDPRVADENYQVAPSEGDLAMLEAGPTSTLWVLCTARIAPDSSGMTVNLLGPLLINPEAGLGVQVVLYDSTYGTAHPAVLSGAGLAAVS
jgi:flagellar assembly factor FliW